MRKLLAAILLATASAAAQVANPSIVLVNSAPTGACGAGLPDEQVLGSGMLYSCQSGTWAAISGGAGSVAFSGVTPGTNTGALVIGSGGSLMATGTGTITATAVPASGITGIIAPAQGGTGVASPTGYAYGNGTSPFTFSTAIPYSAITGGPSDAFSALTSGINTTATMNVGAGAALSIVGLQQGPLTVGAGAAATANYAIAYVAASSTVKTAALASMAVFGIAENSAAAGGTVYVCNWGQCPGVAGNNWTAGDFLIPSVTTPGAFDDSGQVSNGGISMATQIFGRALTSTTTGNVGVMNTVGSGHFGTLVTSASVNSSICSTTGCSGVTISASSYATTTNCSSAASPAVCGSAAAGSILIPVGTVSSTLTVNTTAVTANSQIFFYPDDTLGTRLSTTCNSTLATLVGGSAITARTAGTSFTITFNGTVATNGVCGSYQILN